MEPILRALHRFFATWRFPVFALAVLLLAPLAMGAILLVPGSASGVGAFADDFRAWCFGYDAAQGTYEWAYFMMFFVNPVMLAGVVVGLWWGPLRELGSRGVRHGLPAFAWGAAVIAAMGVGFAVLAADEASKAIPVAFSAEGLRTSLRAPAIELVDHERRPISLAALRGKVVVVTSVYSSCGYACPTIMGQARRAVESLEEASRGEVVVLAVTLDPTHDTPEVLAEMARRQGVESPQFHLLTGETSRVEEALDRIGVARRRDPETGVIDHTNVFLVVDRAGRLAYRFALGEQQEQWLGLAIAHLVAEPRPPL